MLIYLKNYIAYSLRYALLDNEFVRNIVSIFFKSTVLESSTKDLTEFFFFVIFVTIWFVCKIFFKGIFKLKQKR